MREIVLDTETTGLDPSRGDRIVEIGCVELENHLPTGAEFHKYINPERDVPLEVQRVHGLTNEFLADKPLFADVAEGFLAFIQDSPLVIHNAGFDIRFLNAELERLGYEHLPMSRAIDTLRIAQSKFPGAQANLDALCRRFNIDASHRDKHGALIDSYLLADVYLELIGGRQPDLALLAGQDDGMGGESVKVERVFREPRSFPVKPEELEAHEAFLKKYPKSPWIWFERGNGT